MFDGIKEVEEEYSLQTIPETDKVSQKMLFLQNPSNHNELKLLNLHFSLGSFPLVFDPESSQKATFTKQKESASISIEMISTFQNSSKKQYSKDSDNLLSSSPKISSFSRRNIRTLKNNKKRVSSTYRSSGFSADGSRLQATSANQRHMTVNIHNESISKKRNAKLNAQKGLKDLGLILFIKKNARKLSLMSSSNSFRRLNQYHLNLIGDNTCKILNKSSLNYAQKFQNMMSSLADETSEKYEMYDEMISSPKKSRTISKLNQNPCVNIIHKMQRRVNRWCKKLHVVSMRVMKYVKVIRPDSVFKLMIDLFSLGVILFCIFFIPLHNIFWFHQNMFSDLILFLIIIQLLLLIIGLNVGYISNGIIFTNRKLIFKRFLSLETLSDTIYLVLLFNTWSENSDYDLSYIKDSNHLLLSSIMLFLLIFKFFKLKQLINYLVEYLLNLSTTSTLIFSLSQVCFFLIVCAHILSCQWILITKYDSENGDYTWLDKFQLRTASWKEIYLYGFYWAVTTMMTVGYGDILPLTYLEHVFVIIAMMITCCVFAYIMNTIGDILEELNNQRAYLRKQQNMVNHFLKEKKIDNKLQLKIKKHLVNVWNLKKENKMDTNSLIEKIPETFREEVLLQIYGKYVRTNKILKKNFSSKLLDQLAITAKERVFIPDDIIIMVFFFF